MVVFASCQRPPVVSYSAPPIVTFPPAFVTLGVEPVFSQTSPVVRTSVENVMLTLVCNWTLPRDDVVGFANEMVGVVPVNNVVCAAPAENSCPLPLFTCEKLPASLSLPFVRIPPVLPPPNVAVPVTDRLSAASVIVSWPADTVPKVPFTTR